MTALLECYEFSVSASDYKRIQNSRFNKLPIFAYCITQSHIDTFKLDIHVSQLPYSGFLNQARAGCRPARAWFLKVEPVRIVSMCVCVCVCVCACACACACACPPPRLLITSGVI